VTPRPADDRNDIDASRERRIVDATPKLPRQPYPKPYRTLLDADSPMTIDIGLER
jgi:hypothetical protein